MRAVMAGELAASFVFTGSEFALLCAVQMDGFLHGAQYYYDQSIPVSIYLIRNNPQKTYSCVVRIPTQSIYGHKTHNSKPYSLVELHTYCAVSFM